ncbi:MAG TPA: GAF domain-containing protein [Terriglobales bacterium]|nr:GAF domain-containing protein [Terriglobales bacterium]
MYLPGSPQLAQALQAEELLAQASAVLLLLGIGVLVYRSFRTRYLLTWILGWLAYLLHKFVAAQSGEAWARATSVGFYVLAITLFASSVFFYTDRRSPLAPLGGFALLTLAVSLVHVLAFPHSHLLPVLLMLMYAAIRATGAIHLALFSPGRRAVGPILLVIGLLFLHMHQPGGSNVVAGFDIALELLLAVGMAVIVVDDSYERLQRLRVLGAMTTAIAEAQDFMPIVRTALQELKGLIPARAAWYRALDADQLVLVDAIGLSEGYVRARRTISLTDSFTGRAVRKGTPSVVRVSEMDTDLGAGLQTEGFEHVLMIPLLGKKTVIGSLNLGVQRFRNYRADEMEFFSAIANQLGIAIENQRLFGQIMQSQKQWVSTFDSIQDRVLVHDEGFRIVKANYALRERLGIREGPLSGTCETVLPGVGRTWQAWQGCPYCWRASGYETGPDPCFGGYSQVSTSAYNEQETRRVGTVHIIKDVTESRAIAERYRLLFEQVQEGVFISTPDGRLLDCNDAFVHMLGYENRDEVLTLDIPAQLYADPSVRPALLRDIEQKGYLRSFEITLRRKDGSAIPVLETSFARRDESGAVLTYQGFLLDMTEQKKAEDAIRRRNRELNALNTIAVTAAQSLDLDEVLTVALAQVMDLFAADSGSVLLADVEKGVLRRRVSQGQRSAGATGFDEVPVPEEAWKLLRETQVELVTQRHLAQLPPSLQAYVLAEGLQAWMWVVLRTKDKIVGVLGIGSRAPREFSAADENLLMAIGRQLATTIEKIHLYEETRRAYEELTRTQEQLLQSEKMSAIGQLISGVAHELNNPLTAILGYAQLLENEEIPARAQDFVQKMYKQAQRTHKIVQNLLSFSRQRKPQRLQVDLRRVLEDTLALRDYDMKLSNIVVEREFEGNVPQVMGDEHQLEQVFLNIINNAADAMLENGRGGTFRVRIYSDGESVCAEFRDSGPGIKDPKRIFDPFYTTKSVGKGTGLGLSICYGILKEHGGSIFASNHPQGGAVFQVRLPALARPMPTRAAPAARHQAPLHGRVLLLDDEESVLEFEREVLRSAGAEVVACADAEDAISRLRDEHFDAIILDGKMPGQWGGAEVYTWIRSNRPGLEKSVVLAISNPNDPEIRRFLEETGVSFLPKPFDVADLVAVTQRLLHRARAQATV